MLKLPLRSTLLVGILLALGLLLAVGLPDFASAQDGEGVTGRSAFHLENLVDFGWGIYGTGSDFWVSDNRRPYIKHYTNDGKWRGNREFRFDGHDDATGIWSDGVIMYVVDIDKNKVFAYNFSARTRNADKDIPLDGANGGATGLWANRDTRIMYVADWVDDHLYAYNMDTGEYLPGENIPVGFSGNNNPEGIWSDGRTMWVADLHDNKMYAYTLATKARDTSREFALRTDNGDPRGVFSDGSTMWVMNDVAGTLSQRHHDHVLAYDISSITSYDDLRLAGAKPSGMWSDGETVWVSDWGHHRIFAYTVDGNRRQPDLDFDALDAAGNHGVHGIWSNGKTMWAADWNDAKLYAYNVTTRAHDSAKDIDLHADNANPLDIWSDGSTIWVADSEDKKAYAYYLSGGERRPGKDIGFYSGIEPFGIWSDGNIMWVADGATDTMYAYTFDGQRRSSRDIDLDAANGSPRGIWSDGTTMRVLEHNSPEVYEYPLFPPAVHLPGHHGQTSGVWSDGDTTWVSNWGYDTIFAYGPDGARRQAQDFDTLVAAGNGDPHGIWSDGTTMWVADWNDPKLYAYNLASKAHDGEKDISLHADNARPLDIWSDGGVMYVADAEDGKLYAYTLSGQRLPDRDVAARTDFGIWSNGSILWTADGDGGTLPAYTMAGARQRELDIPLDAANGSPRGIWSDGETMRALQGNAATMFSYRMPVGVTVSYPASYYATRFREEGDPRRSRLTATLTGGRVAPSDITLSVALSHVTTDDDDFERVILADITIAAGQASGGANHDFWFVDDADNEGVEVVAITASGAYPGTGEPLTARDVLLLIDDDPVPTSIPDLAAGPVAGDTTRLRVSWGSVPDAEEYRVEHRTANGSYSAVARADATATSETITGLTADTTYTVRVTAIDTDDGGSADLVSGETDGTTLDAMGAVTVAAVADKHDRLDVSWPAVNGATGYRVEWKATGGSYSAVARGDAAAASETITGLTPKTGYTVRVTALHTIDGQTADGDSAEGSGTTGSDRTVSATDAAGALRVEQLFSSGIDLLWDPVASVDGNAVTGYTIEWASGADGPWVALDFPGEGRHCIANMTVDYLTSNGELKTECYFSYSEAGDKIASGSAYYYRLVAHAGDVDSQPGQVLSRRVAIGGL